MTLWPPHTGACTSMVSLDSHTPPHTHMSSYTQSGFKKIWIYFYELGCHMPYNPSAPSCFSKSVHSCPSSEVVRPGWLNDVALSLQLPCWGESRALVSNWGPPCRSQIFLPPLRSVSVIKSNFGMRSGSLWKAPHSIRRPVIPEFPPGREPQGGNGPLLSRAFSGPQNGLRSGWH